MEDSGVTGETVSTTPNYIMTLDDLVQNHDITLRSENTDKFSMNTIIKPNTTEMKEKLIQWALGGFLHGYQVLSVFIIRPSPCSDNQHRSMESYIEYITGSDITTLVTNFQSNFLGIYFSYSISGNLLSLYVSKNPPISGMNLV